MGTYWGRRSFLTVEKVVKKILQQDSVAEHHIMGTHWACRSPSNIAKKTKEKPSTLSPKVLSMPA